MDKKNVKVSAELHAKLKAYSETSGISIERIVNSAITYHLKVRKKGGK